MSSITAYVLKDDGSLDCIRTGDVNNVIYAVEVEKKEYTLQPPPVDDKEYRWVNNEWIADETAK